jgi:hypothetical protein
MPFPYAFSAFEMKAKKACGDKKEEREVGELPQKTPQASEGV